MPNLKSAEKRVRQTAKRTEHKKHVKTTCRTYVKRVRAALSQGDAARAREQLQLASKRLDRAVRQGVFHRNTAARTISRLSHQLSQLEQRS